MIANTFTYRVAFDLHASARLSKNLIPRPGTITLDESGTLRLIDTSDQQTIIQKPFTEIAGIRPLGLGSKFNFPKVLIYVSHNEAYKITFFSRTANPHDTLGMYQKLLQGDKEAAITEFKMRTKPNRSIVIKERNEASADYMNFIAKAKQMGVYKSTYSSALFIITIVIVLVVTGILLITFQMTR